MKFSTKILTVFLAGLLFSQVSANPTQIKWEGSSVDLAVDDGVARIEYQQIPLSLNMVVLDAMKMAGTLEFSAKWYRSFRQWMVTSINGKENQGDDGKNWLLCVNDNFAGVGPGSYVLGPDMQIAWVFKKYSENACAKKP